MSTLDDVDEKFPQLIITVSYKLIISYTCCIYYITNLGLPTCLFKKLKVNSFLEFSMAR